MAILDERTELADALALGTGTTGRQLVGDVIDLQAGGLAIAPNPAGAPGSCDGMFFNVQVDTAFAGGGGAAVALELVSDAQIAIALDGSATQHVATSAIPVASLVPGFMVMSLEVPRRPIPERYLGLIANVTGAQLNAGKLNCWLSAGPVTAPGRLYADNIA